MANYIGKVQINSNDRALIGSTLYGICYTEANQTVKDVTVNTRGSNNPLEGEYVNTHYNNLTRGTTVHIKFIYGNTVTSNAYLQVGTTSAQPILGNFVCPANTVISFTLDETPNQNWVVNDGANTTYTFAEGTTNGTINVTPSDSATAQAIPVHGLNDAAYKGVATSIGSSNNSSTAVPTVSAVYSFVQEQTGGLAGLTGAMHFRGIATTAVSDGHSEDPEISTYDFGVNGANAIDGDVVTYNNQEYVWVGTAWELLGDEGSYALKTSTASVINTISFTANTIPTLTTTVVNASKVTVTSGTAASLATTSVNIPNVTAAGKATTASISAGVLNITIGSDTLLGTAISVTSVNSFTANSPTVVTASEVNINSVTAWNAGTAASLASTTTIVVIPS